MQHVLIATHGRPRLLERTLASLAECDVPATFSGTNVVENGRPESAEDAVRSAPPKIDARYLHHGDANKSGALNRALRELHDGLIIFLDDDVLVSTQLLRAYADAAEGVRSGVFFGGPVVPEYEEPPPSWLVEYLPFSAKGWTLEEDTDWVDSPVFLGANWAAFATDLRTAGGFDPSFGPGAVTGSLGQERAMQKRLIEAGLRGRYVREAKVWHWVPRERCSTRWALGRMYRDGIQRGLNADTSAEPPRVWGYPRWAIRRALEEATRALVCSGHPSPTVRLCALRAFLLTAGYLKGSRLAFQRRRSSQEDKPRST